MNVTPQGPVLVAFDGSDQARAAVELVPEMFPDRRVLVITVWESYESMASASHIAVPAGVAGQGIKELDAESEREAARVAEVGAEPLRDRGADVSTAALRAHGNVWSTIVRAAEENDAAVVVIGSRGRSAVKSALLGSVSHGVVQHSSRPVLLARAQ